MPGISDYDYLTSSIFNQKSKKYTFYSKQYLFSFFFSALYFEKKYGRKWISQLDCIIQNSTTFFETVKYDWQPPVHIGE